MTDRPDIDASDALCDAATPGPWYKLLGGVDLPGLRPDHAVVRTGTEPTPYIKDVAGVSPRGIRVSMTQGKCEQESANAEFIAHARMALPAHNAYIRVLEARLAERNAE